MSSSSYLIDTDVFIDHLRRRARLVVPAGVRRISVITRIELLSGKNSEEGQIIRLLSAFEESVVDRETAEEAGRIRRQSGIALADAVIAATARLTNSILVTRNRAHFAKVPKLHVMAPTKS